MEPQVRHVTRYMQADPTFDAQQNLRLFSGHFFSILSLPVEQFCDIRRPRDHRFYGFRWHRPPGRALQDRVFSVDFVRALLDYGCNYHRLAIFETAC